MPPRSSFPFSQNTGLTTEQVLGGFSHGSANPPSIRRKVAVLTECGARLGSHPLELHRKAGGWHNHPLKRIEYNKQAESWL
jgi:hypothetical protein